MDDYKKQIEELQKQIVELTANNEFPNRKFKTGDWVCYDFGEYPEHFCQEPWEITHWSFDYSKSGNPMGRIHKSSGSAHSENCLRYAHPKEIEYYKSKLPFIYNKVLSKYEIIEILDDGRHFKLGSGIDSRNMKYLSGKEIITFLLSTNYITPEGMRDLSLISENLK